MTNSPVSYHIDVEDAGCEASKPSAVVYSGDAARLLVGSTASYRLVYCCNYAVVATP